MRNSSEGRVPDESSPFAGTELKPLGTVTQEGKHLGIKLADGSVLVNFAPNTNYNMLNLMAKHVEGEVVVITGKWTFVPEQVVSPKKRGH